MKTFFQLYLAGIAVWSCLFWRWDIGRRPDDCDVPQVAYSATTVLVLIGWPVFTLALAWSRAHQWWLDRTSRRYLQRLIREGRIVESKPTGIIDTEFKQDEKEDKQ